jgi:hypothetical protein
MRTRQWLAVFQLGAEVAFTATQILMRLLSRRLPLTERLVDFLDVHMPFGYALAASSLMIACKLHDRYGQLCLSGLFHDRAMLAVFGAH